MFNFLKKKKAQQELEQRQQKAREQAERIRQEMEQSRLEAQRSFEHKQAEIQEAVDSVSGSEKYRLSTSQTEATVHTLNITEFSKIYATRYIAFDLETTGLNPVEDKIVEIGAVLVENGSITREYHQLVDPGCPMPPSAYAVHRISDDMLVGQPKIHQVLPSFLSFVGDDVLAAHNAVFDLKFISQACMRNRFRIPLGFFDTMTLARYWPESEDKKLISLCDVANVETGTSHRALDDARAVSGFISASMIRRADMRKKKA